MDCVYHSNTEAKPAMSGKVLAAWARKVSPARRANYAVALTERVTPFTFTRAQAAAMVDVSTYSVSIAALATTDEVIALELGEMTLADVRKAHAHAKPVNTSTETVRGLIDRYGADAFLSEIDAMTAPPALMAAE
jgi:hypothetical protein